MSDAQDILLGHVEVQKRADGQARIVAVDRHGVETLYADWAEPVQVEPPPAIFDPQ